MFYRVALSNESPYNVAQSDDGETFSIPGTGVPVHRDELSEITPLDVPLVTYQDGSAVKIGDRVRTIDGEHEGLVEELHHPRGVFTAGRVKLHNNKLISGGVIYKL